MSSLLSRLALFNRYPLCAISFWDLNNSKEAENQPKINLTKPFQVKSFS